MKPELARVLYDAAGVTARNDPKNAASRFAGDRIRAQLEGVVRSGMKALDLGCGTGRFPFAMEALGARATGADCAEIPLPHAQRLARRRGSRCEFVQGVLPHRPLANHRSDLPLLVNNIVEFSASDVDHLSREVARVLRNGGRLCRSMRGRRLRFPREIELDRGRFWLIFQEGQTSIGTKRRNARPMDELESAGPAAGRASDPPRWGGWE